MPSVIRDYFDRSAPQRDQLIAANPIIDYEQAVRARAVFALADLQPSDCVLDVGCGSGRDLPFIARIASRCVALDYSLEMIRAARSQGSPIRELLVGDATALPFPDGSFDKVIASEVIEHIPDWRRAIREMARVLRPGGRLVLTTPNRRSWYGLDRFLIEQVLRRRWNHPYDRWKTHEELANAVSAAGLRIVDSLGVCYVPGFALTYRAPQALQLALVRLISQAESALSRRLPHNGYMLALAAEKPA